MPHEVAQTAKMFAVISWCQGEIRCLIYVDKKAPSHQRICSIDLSGLLKYAVRTSDRLADFSAERFSGGRTPCQASQS